MASWKDWVDEKVDKIVNTGVKVGDKPYYAALPQRNPNDPADRAYSAAGQGAWSNVRGAVPEMTGQALQETGRQVSRASFPITGGAIPFREAAGEGLANLGTAIREFGESAPAKPQFATPAEGGIYNAAKSFTNPAVAIPYLSAAAGPGMLAGSAISTALHDLSARTQGREAAIRGLRANSPAMAISHTAGDYPLARATALNLETPRPGLVPQEGDMVRNGRIYSGPAQTGAKLTGALPTGETETPTGGNRFNDLTRWDMARALGNAGITVPQMNREEMIQTLSAKTGRGGLANVGTLNDDQLRDLMDRRGLNYFKMSDQDMRATWLPIEEKNARNRPAALFTGDANRGGAQGVPTSQQALNTMLQKYLTNPDSYSPRDLAALANAIKTVAESGEVAPNAAAERKLKEQHGGYYEGLRERIPSEIQENVDKSGYYRTHGAEAPLVLSPGQVAVRPNKEAGYPASEIARGLPEKAATPGAAERMDEVDKLDFQTASKIAMDPMATAEEKAEANRIRNQILGKYGRNTPAVPSQPPTPDAILKRHPTTGAPIWVDKKTRKVIEENP